MAEGLGGYFSFVGNLFHYFWEMFFENTGAIMSAALKGPFSHPFETIVAIFLLLALVTTVTAVGWSLLRMSPAPFILVVEKFNRFFGFVGAWIIVILIITMVWEVIARYFFDAPTQWAFEMGYMLMGASFMLGIAVTMQMRRHIRVDFVYDHVGPKKKAIIDLIGYFFLIPMLLWLTAGLWDYFAEAYRVDETSGESAWNPIIWPFKFSFVMGFIMLSLQTLVETLKSIMVLAGYPQPEPPPIEGLE